MQRLDFDHEVGAHCGSTSLRDLSTYYGWGFDEPTCFGLGEGLGFSYLELPDTPHRAIFGRTGWLERAFFENCGIDHTIHEGEDFETAWAELRGRIDDGDPVMIFTDLFYLDYYDSSTHFAPHSLLVVGYDDETVHLADSEFDEIQQLPLDRLEEALTATHVVPLQCRYLTIDDPTMTVDFETAAERALEETATYMLDPGQSTRESKYFSGQGVGEVQRFGEELLSWDDLPDPSWTIRFAYQNVERRGTGGGAFRRLFADFLATVPESVPLPDGAAAEMVDIADDWTELAGVLREASETESAADRQSLLWEASEQVEAVGEREADLYRKMLAEFEA
jgi:hypothetical protein